MLYNLFHYTFLLFSNHLRIFKLHCKKKTDCKRFTLKNYNSKLEMILYLNTRNKWLTKTKSLLLKKYTSKIYFY